MSIPPNVVAGRYSTGCLLSIAFMSPANPVVDRASLIELGLLPDPVRGWPLGPWLDHTHAPPSRAVLERLLALPLPSAEAIGIRQQLLQQLATVARHLPLADWASLAERSRRFLKPNYDIAPAAISAPAVKVMTSPGCT